MSKRNLLLIVILTMIAMMVAACGGGGGDEGGNGGDSGSTAPPEDVMAEVLETVFTGQISGLTDLVCESARAELEAEEAPDEVLPDGFEFDASGLEYSSEIDGDTATVTVTGEIAVTMEIDGESMTQSTSVDDLGDDFAAAPFVREDGEWKFCPETTEG